MSQVTKSPHSPKLWSNTLFPCHNIFGHFKCCIILNIIVKMILLQKWFERFLFFCHNILTTKTLFHYYFLITKLQSYQSTTATLDLAIFIIIVFSTGYSQHVNSKLVKYGRNFDPLLITIATALNVSGFVVKLGTLFYKH